MIYLDYQATTPLAPEALEAMLPWLTDKHANPHSAHKAGREAAAVVEVARNQVAALLPPGGRLVFTSGATEALNMAIGGAVARLDMAAASVVTLATEHAAVLDTVQALSAGRYEVRVAGVDREGLAGEFPVDSGTVLVTSMSVNNEIGVIQPVRAIAHQAHKAGALFLCDAVQGYGRVELPETADMIAISAHKIHGPKGIGALWLRDGVSLAPLQHGGGQEQGIRSGTLSPALCAGFGAAAKLAKDRRETDAVHVEALWTRAMERLPAWTINGSATHRYHGNLNIRRDGLDAARLMSECRDLAISAGSACASGSGRPSHVLKAIGLSDAEARSSLRLGFGRYTTIDQIETAADMINAAARAQGLDA